MKIQKFVPILLASALLASCKIGTPDVSSSSPSNEQSASSALPSEESTAPVTSEETSASSEETPISSETSSSSEEPVAPSVAWTYDKSYGAEFGNSFGVAALTGDDTNENKALVAQYNKLLLAKGWTKATDSDFDDFDIVGLALYGTNVYCMDDSDSNKRLVAEIIPCADAEGDGLMTYAPMDPEGNEITSGIFIVVQTA